jgi:hypothetical protein
MAFVKDEWWHVDSAGRRIGWLWPEDMESILESFYGERKWVNKFSKSFGFARSTVDRWKEGHTPIPKHVAQIINMLGTLKVRGLPMTDVEAPWLPEGDGANASGVVTEPADAGAK